MAGLAEENTALRKALETARGGAPDAAALALGQAYVAGLRRDAALAQAPLGDAEVAQVETLLRQGHVDAARVVGDVLLTKSRAEGQVKFRHAQAVSLEEAPPDPQAVETAAKARLLRHRGYQVDLSQDGTRIERAVAPKKGAARTR
jgi:hypothetical protein